MSKLNALSTRDVGFDLVLGEQGLLEVERASALRSATILVRGAPGAGKSAMALHLALVAAEARGVAVGYACVELLPAELQALSGELWPARGVKFVSSPLQTERNQVVARLLADERGAPDLAEFLDRLVQQSAPSGGPVLVIDSLLRDSEFGGAATRETVDAVCKYAVATGAILILVEESLGGASPWMWSVDTVLEVAQPIGDETSERTLVVSKHRFGACDPGPHRWSFTAQGLEVYPRCAAYLRPWAAEAARTTTTLTLSVPAPTPHDVALGTIELPATIGVVSSNPNFALVTAKALANSMATRTLYALVGHSYSPLTTDEEHTTLRRLGESIERGCARVWAAIDRKQRTVVVLTDLARLHGGGAEHEAVSLLIEGLRRRGVTTIVVQTARVDTDPPGWSLRLPLVPRVCEVNVVVNSVGFVKQPDERWSEIELLLRTPDAGGERYLMVR